MSFDLSLVPNWCDYGSLYQEVVTEYLSKIDRPVRCLELGSFMGKSTSILGGLLRDHCKIGSYVVTVDHCQGSKTERELQWLAYAAGGNYATQLIRTINETGVAPYVIPLICDFETAYRFLGCQKEGFDFIFLDGGHTKAEVWNDLGHCARLAREGCIWAGHDYTSNWPEVIEAVNQYFGIPSLQRDEKMAFIKASSGTCWSYRFPYFQETPTAV